MSSNEIGEDGFKRVVENFKTHLQPSELESFQSTSHADMQTTLRDLINGNQQYSPLLKLKLQLPAFMDAMMQYERMLEQFPNSPDHQYLLRYIWGPMKLIIVLASKRANVLESLLDSYDDLGKCLPRLPLQYMSLFPMNDIPRLKQLLVVLVAIYEGIISFHQHALRVLRSPARLQGIFFSVSWKSFHRKSTEISQDLIRLTSFIVTEFELVSRVQMVTAQSNMILKLGEIRGPKDHAKTETHGDLYRSLSVENYEIRLLVLEADIDNSTTICCTLEYVSLIEPPAYRALSYCWGAQGVTETIKVNDTNVQATVNLVAALRQLRSEGHTRLWVDAVCINQTDREERALQVQLMKSIFSEAAEVIVWVGLEDQHSTMALDFLERIGRISIDDIDDVVSGRTQLASAETKRASWSACELFFSRPYWKRVWVIQEIAVATKVLVQCGKRVTSWQDIRQGLRFTGLVDFERFRDHFAKGDRGRLLDALLETRSSLATDPRDKVYALLGLTSDGSDIIRLPNYRQPVELVLKQMTKAMLLRGWLDIITLRHSDHVELDDMPSWVPHWLDLEEAVKPWQLQHFQDLKNQYDQPVQNFRKAHVEFHGDTLVVTGQILGFIERLSTSFCHRRSDNEERKIESIDGFILEQALGPGYGCSSMELCEAVSKTHPNFFHWVGFNGEFFFEKRSIAEYFHRNNLLELGTRAFRAWLDNQEELINEDLTRLEKLPKHLALIERILTSRVKVFETKRGRIGIVHDEAEIGDAICSIEGCNIQVILRKCEEYWTVVGEAFSSGPQVGLVEHGFLDDALARRFHLK